MTTKLDDLLDRRARLREAEARARALRALEDLEGAGVRAVVAGSLARGVFKGHSDVDILVLDRATASDTEIFGIVDRAMQGFPFDLVYLEAIPPETRDHMLSTTADASDLRSRP